ncbi:MAG: MgtC/SapB family protein [Candidatus Bathyarchaeota archaeon]
MKLVLIFVLGGIVGLEREVKVKPAGLRTHILVGMASTLLTILSSEAFPGSDQARIAAAVVLGMGFIGAGAILKTEDKISGLTTAASLWITSAIGVTIGTGYYILAIVTTALTYLCLKLRIFEQSG